MHIVEVKAFSSQILLDPAPCGSFVHGGVCGERMNMTSCVWCVVCVGQINPRPAAMHADKHRDTVLSDTLCVCVCSMLVLTADCVLSDSHLT